MPNDRPLIHGYGCSLDLCGCETPEQKVRCAAFAFELPESDTDGMTVTVYAILAVPVLIAFVMGLALGLWLA